MNKMSASNDAHSSEHEIVNGRPQGEKEHDVESKPKSQCKNDTSVATQTESLSDWFVLVCVFFTNIMNGINYSTYGVLYMPIAEMFNESRAAVGWIQSFDFALGTFLGIFISHPVNMYGCRLPATIGSLLITAGGMLSCFSPSLIWMYILKGIIPGVGQSMALLGCQVIIQQRFHKHRSFATGMSIIGWSVGNFFGAPLTELLYNSYGLRGTLALLGAIQSHRIPLALQFRSPKMFRTASNRAESSESSDKSTAWDKFKCYIKGSLNFTLLRHTPLLLFCLTGVLQKFTVNCYVPHIVNWSVAAAVPRHLAVWAVSTLSCATTFCRVIVSLIADKKFVNRLLIYACGLFFEFLMCFPPLVFPGIAGTYVSVVLFGFHAGCTHTLNSVVLVDLLGVENIARCLALHALFVSFSLLTGSPFMGLMYDVTGSYQVGFVILSCIALTAVSLMLATYFTDRRHKKTTAAAVNNTMTLVVNDSRPSDTK